MSIKNLRIAFLTSDDPLDKRSWSGTTFYMFRSLEQTGAHVQALGPAKNPLKLTGQIVNKISRTVIGKRYNYRHSLQYSKKFAGIFEEKLKAEGPFDIIFAPAASSEIAFLETETPIIYTSDATFRVMNNYYDAFSSVLESVKNQNDEIESRSITKAAALTYPSEWAANSAIRDYGANPDLVHIIPYGANLDKIPPRKNVLNHSAPKNSINILFVGVDWERKRGAIVFQVVQQLRARGYDTTLTIIGCSPPSRFQKEFVTIYPFLDKNDHDQFDTLSELYLKSDFFVMPTLNECYGIVFCEAAAFGVPVLATKTGGVPTIVKDGLNGFLLEPDADIEAFIEKILTLTKNKTLYNKMKHDARDRYESLLNWTVWGQKMEKVIESVL